MDSVERNLKEHQSALVDVRRVNSLPPLARFRSREDRIRRRSLCFVTSALVGAFRVEDV